MTEKNYGGNTSFGFKGKGKQKLQIEKDNIQNQKSNSSLEKENKISSQNKENEELIKAGKIAREVINYARSFIKAGMPLLEIAEKIESKIIELGGKPAFPVNLSINEVAAHATPLYNDASTAHGLLKVDLGVQINGYIADTAFSLDLENNEENKKLIKSAEDALASACERIKNGQVKIREIGASIEKSIHNSGFQPIQNLSGHSIQQYEIHAGLTIPNYDNAQEKFLPEGVYAVEPFATNGLGKVRDGKPSTIYALANQGNVRDSFARQVIAFIQEEYQTLPFCTRWLYKKFGSRVILALRNIEQAGLLHQYAQLIETGKGKVAQAEHTIIYNSNPVITTL